MAAFNPFAAVGNLNNVSNQTLAGVPATAATDPAQQFTQNLPDLTALSSPLASTAGSVGAPGVAAARPSGTSGVGLPTGQWAQQILQALGAPETQANLQALAAWHQAEGGSASYNPFNTTQPEAGASNYNSVGVKNYSSPQQGLQATVQTLQNGDYKNILAALMSGNSAQAVGQAIANSPWGTGALVLKVLGY